MATIDDVYNAVVALTTKVDAIKEKTDQIIINTVPKFIPNPLNDQYYGNVLSLLHMNGSYLDEKGLTYIEYGVMSSSTSIKKFGSASAAFNGASYIGTNTSVPYSSGSFTVEMWIYVIDRAINRGIFYCGDLNSNLNRIQVDYKTDGTLTAYIQDGTANESIASSAGLVTINTWHHIALSATSGTMRLFFDGTLVGGLAKTLLPSYPSTIYLGVARNSSLIRYHYGYMDEVRITNGIARYTAPFTPSSYPFVLNEMIQNGTVAAVSSQIVASDISMLSSSTDSCDLSAIQVEILGIKTKTDQLTFSAGGVVADVEVSVGNVINYDARFDALDLTATGIKDKTDQMSFSGPYINAQAVMDLSPVVSAVSSAVGSAIAPVQLAINDTNADLALHDTQIKTQLTTIQNATGAIDLTPIITGLATVNTNVLGIPTTTYTTRLNGIDAQLTSIQADIADVAAGVDFTPVLTAVAGVQADTDAIQTAVASIDFTPVLTAVAGVQADTDLIQTAVAGITLDLTPATDAIAAVQATANQVAATTTAIKVKTDTIAPCDTSAVVSSINALSARFDAVPEGPVVVIPQASEGTTTLFGYCLNQDGSPVVGDTVTIYVQQASGSGALLASTGQVKQSGASGLVTCVVPRGTQYVYAIQYGKRVERIAGVDAGVLELPSIIKRD